MYFFLLPVWGGSPAKKVISLLSCWFLDIRNPKWPGSSERLSFNRKLAVGHGKSVSFLGTRASTVELSVVGIEAQGLRFYFMTTVFMCSRHDLAPEPQGPSEGFSHWGLPQIPLFFPTTNTTNTIESVELGFSRSKDLSSSRSHSKMSVFQSSVCGPRPVSIGIKYPASKTRRGKPMAYFPFYSRRCKV